MEKNLKNKVNEELQKAAEHRADEKGLSLEDYNNDLLSGAKEALKPNNLNNNRSMYVLSELQQLMYVCYQNVINEVYLSYDDAFIDFFKWGSIDGNTKQEVINAPVGGYDFKDVENLFVPEKITEYNNHEVFQLSIKDPTTNDYTNNTIRRHYSITIRKLDLLQNFINGQLDDFISNFISSRLYQPLKLELYHTFMSELTKNSNYRITINGTAPDLFTAITDEILPALSEFAKSSTHYNLKEQSLIANGTKTEDIILIMSTKNLVRFNSSIMSLTYNNSQIDLKKYCGTILAPHNKIISNPGEVIKFDTENQYVDDNTIFVIDKKNFIRFCTWFEQTGQQEWITNITITKVLNYFYTYGFPSWAKGFIYKNENLKVIPQLR